MSGRIKDLVNVIINTVPRLSADVFGNEWPPHDHGMHSGLEDDDHVQYMLCSAGEDRPFVGDVWMDEVKLTATANLRFDDRYRVLHTIGSGDWTQPGIDLSSNSGEWQDYYDLFGNGASILKGIISAYEAQAYPLLDDHAVGYGDSDSHIAGDTAHFYWDYTAFKLTVASVRVTGVSELYGDVKTDRWLYNDTNLFLGVGVAGAGALQHTTGNEGYYNVAFGYSAGYALTTGAYNTLVGSLAGYALTTGNYNVAFGYRAGYALTTGSYNTLVGPFAGKALTTGVSNVALGDRAGYAITSGLYNTLVGPLAGYALTTGGSNVAFGYRAGYAITSGPNNTLVGPFAGTALTTGGSNLLLGYGAGGNQTTGSGNVAAGASALAAVGTAGFNTAVGTNALMKVVNQYNCGVGYNAGAELVGADGTTFIGCNAGYNATSASYSISIGYNSALPSATTQYQLNIGNALYGLTNLGFFGVNKPIPTCGLQVGNGTAALVSSSSDLSVAGKSEFCDEVYFKALATPANYGSIKHDVTNLVISANTGTVGFGDAYAVTGGWTGGYIPLSMSADEWGDIEALSGGEYSLFTAILAAASSGGGGGTLDDAYDYETAGAGRAITVDAGAVAMTTAAELACNTLELSQGSDGYTALKIDQDGSEDNGVWFGEVSHSIYLTGDALQGQVIYSDRKLIVGAYREDNNVDVAVVAMGYGEGYDTTLTLEALSTSAGEVSGKATAWFRAEELTNGNFAEVHLEAQDGVAPSMTLKVSAGSTNDNAEMSLRTEPNGSGTGIITIDADRVLFGDAEIRSLRMATYGTAPTTASFASGTITVNWLTGKPVQTVSVNANVTALSMTAPSGVGLGLTISITASGGARTIGGLTGVSWSDGSDLSGAAAMTIPSGDWLDIHMWYDGTNYHGCVLPEAV